MLEEIRKVMQVGKSGAGMEFDLVAMEVHVNAIIELIMRAELCFSFYIGWKFLSTFLHFLDYIFRAR